MKTKRKYKGRITDGWPRDMWPHVKAQAAAQKQKDDSVILQRADDLGFRTSSVKDAKKFLGDK